jgi:hypothetical protein
MTPPPKWTRRLTDEEVAPRESKDCLRRAVNKLGPFKHRLNIDAEQYGPLGGSGNRIPLSEEYAVGQVVRLADAFNRHLGLESTALRSKHVIDELNKLETLTGELTRHMRSLADETRHRLHTAGSGIDRFFDFCTSQWAEQADWRGLPVPGGDDEWDNQSPWIERLEGLSRYANETLGAFLISKGIDDVEKPDKGGNTNLFKEDFGSARWQFVSQAWHSFEAFKPGMSSGTEGGPFHLFLLDVFEYATGLDPEEHSKLMPYIKQVVPVNRKQAELTKREYALIEEQAEIDAPDSKLTTAERKRRHLAVEAKLIAINQERYDLWPKLYPFTKSNKLTG